MTVQVSRLIRLGLLDRMAIFNSLVDEACGDINAENAANGRPSIDSYHINFDRTEDQPQNFYEGNRTLDMLNLYREPDFPALTFWMAEGGMGGIGQRTVGTVFSGAVMAHWRFFLSVKGRQSIGLVDLQEATQSAMIAMLDDEFSGFQYRGDLAWQAPPEQVWSDRAPDPEHIGFIQEIEFAAGFEVTVA